jgi:hypothetical protein
LLLEPISPRFVSFWLRRRLKNWKNKGLIDDYRVKMRRIGKFHYRIEVDVDLRSQQANQILGDTLVRMLKRIWR